MKFSVRLLLCFMISFSLVEFPILKAQAHAGMISTSEVVADLTRADSEKAVLTFLDRSEVREQLTKLGVNPEEASVRMASLSDAEVRSLAGEIEKSSAGGDVGGILIVVLLVVLIIFLVKRI